MLEIKDLHVDVDGQKILKGIDLTLADGEVSAIMGPNGSGKSTLSYVIAGREGYEITQGDILLNGDSILEMEPEERSRAGLFLALQYPIEIPGVAMMTFLREAVNAHRTARGEDELDPLSFAKLVRAKARELKMTDEMLKRQVNSGFSGGEKKRAEILQMKLLEPSICVLDETDSGLDIDALRIVSEGVNAMRSPDRSILVITHYQRLLSHIVPDKIHVLAGGRIIRSGGKDLAHELEAHGYESLLDDAA